MYTLKLAFLQKPLWIFYNDQGCQDLEMGMPTSWNGLTDRPDNTLNRHIAESEVKIDSYNYMSI